MTDGKEQKEYRASAQDVANKYGVHINSVYNWLKSSNPPPHRKIGGQYRFNLDELDTWTKPAEDDQPAEKVG